MCLGLCPHKKKNRQHARRAVATKARRGSVQEATVTTLLKEWRPALNRHARQLTDVPADRVLLRRPCHCSSLGRCVWLTAGQHLLSTPSVPVPTKRGCPNPANQWKILSWSQMVIRTGLGQTRVPLTQPHLAMVVQLSAHVLSDTTMPNNCPFCPRWAKQGSRLLLVRNISLTSTSTLCAGDPWWPLINVNVPPRYVPPRAPGTQKKKTETLRVSAARTSVQALRKCWVVSVKEAEWFKFRRILGCLHAPVGKRDAARRKVLASDRPFVPDPINVASRAAHIMVNVVCRCGPPWSVYDHGICRLSPRVRDVFLAVYWDGWRRRLFLEPMTCKRAGQVNRLMETAHRCVV